MDTRPPPPPGRAVATFGDALGLAFELTDRHPTGQFVAVVDRCHRLVRLTVRTPGSRSDVTIELVPHPRPAQLVRQLGEGQGGLLAISATARFAPFSPADLAVYERLRHRLGRQRIVLLDWVRTDGDLYQSAAWASDPASAWPRDPPGERSARHGRP